MVPKAEDKSNNNENKPHPLSTFNTVSLNTLSSVVSVAWSALKADCNS